MLAKRAKSISNLLLMHELAFICLVTITAIICGLSAYFWQKHSAESIRINELLSVTEQVRGSLFRQIQAAIRVRVLEDPKSLDAYTEYSRRIDKKYNRLRTLSKDRAEDMHIQNMHASYREIQRDMNKIFTDPYISDVRVRMKILDPRFAESMVDKFEHQYEAFREWLLSELEALDKTREFWAKYAPFIIPLPIFLAMILPLAARSTLKRGFVEPMSDVMEGAQMFAEGNLRHQIPQHGVDEVRKLAESINLMASDLEQSRDALVQSEKQAALGALVPVVAHNIRNPLASIRATAQVLEDVEDEEELHESKQAIIDTIDRLGRWVNALVSYLHPLKPNKRQVELYQLLDSPLQLLKDKIEQKQIQVTLDCQEEGWPVLVDPDLMEQALYGLMANAIDASDKEARLMITADYNDNEATIYLEDEGGGLPFIPKAGNLEPGPSTKRLGTGLGIPIAYKICQTHGWNIEFEIDKNKGTKIIITCPNTSSTEESLP